MEKGLVSILTPAYNSGTFIARLLKSVLSQTYPNVSMLIIDDGSTDNTEDVVRSFIPLFEKRGYKLSIIKQENAGQSSAINNGLKLVDGEFLAWPDSDDFYATDEAIEKMVAALKAEPASGICYCYANVYDGNCIAPHFHNTNTTSIFEDAIYGRNGFYFQPIAYMAKCSELFKYLSDREIYHTHDAGQNWQLMLPLFFHTKCVCVPEYLCNVYVRPASHSRGQYNSVVKKAELINSYHETLRHVIPTIGMKSEEESLLMLHIEKHYAGWLFQHFWETKSFTKFRKAYKQHPNAHTKKWTWDYFLSYIPVFRRIQLSDGRIRKILFLNQK